MFFCWFVKGVLGKLDEAKVKAEEAKGMFSKYMTVFGNFLSTGRLVSFYYREPHMAHTKMLNEPRLRIRNSAMKLST
jgi:hypothetical protein